MSKKEKETIERAIQRTEALALLDEVRDNPSCAPDLYWYLITYLHASTISQAFDQHQTRTHNATPPIFEQAHSVADSDMQSDDRCAVLEDCFRTSFSIALGETRVQLNRRAYAQAWGGMRQKNPAWQPGTESSILQSVQRQIHQPISHDIMRKLAVRMHYTIQNGYVFKAERLSNLITPEDPFQLLSLSTVDPNDPFESGVASLEQLTHYQENHPALLRSRIVPAYTATYVAMQSARALVEESTFPSVKNPQLYIENITSRASDEQPIDPYALQLLPGYDHDVTLTPAMVNAIIYSYNALSALSSHQLIPYSIDYDLILHLQELARQLHTIDCRTMNAAELTSVEHRLRKLAFYDLQVPFTTQASINRLLQYTPSS